MLMILILPYAPARRDPPHAATAGPISPRGVEPLASARLVQIQIQIQILRGEGRRDEGLGRLREIQ